MVYTTAFCYSQQRILHQAVVMRYVPLPYSGPLDVASWGYAPISVCPCKHRGFRDLYQPNILSNPWNLHSGTRLDNPKSWSRTTWSRLPHCKCRLLCPEVHLMWETSPEYTSWWIDEELFLLDVCVLGYPRSIFWIFLGEVFGMWLMVEEEEKREGRDKHA